MSDVTVRQLAGIVGIPLDRLLHQLGDAGLQISDADDVLSDAEKMKLLNHLRQSHGKVQESVTEPKRVTLQRRSVTELKQGTVPGKGAKTISVEVRKKRTYVKRSELPETSDRLSEAEQARRALEEQQQRELAEQEARRQQEEMLREQAAEEERRRQEEAARTAEERRRRDEEERQAAAERETVAAKPAPVAAPPIPRPAPEPRPPARPSAGKPKAEAPRAHPAERETEARGDKRSAGLSRKDEYRELQGDDFRKGGGKRKKPKTGRPMLMPEQKHGFEKPTAPIVYEVAVPESITVSDLAQRMSVKGVEVIKALMKMGVMATINQVLDQETAILVVEEMGHKAIAQKEDDLEAEIMANLAAEAEAPQLPRPPVVTIMGHVDHGKTSLLDYIRKSRVAAGEAGGITQHIGAYQVKTDHGSITFLDTPGHAAFTAMRARGAKVTDIVVLVVAADDGVMPQTREAVEHSRAAGVPLVVAMNKMDKADADPDRVKQELVGLNVVPEEWGGDVQFVPVSAKTGAGIDTLLDAILVQAEVLELKAPVAIPAAGVVLESKLEKGRGPVADILIQRGTLKKGDFLLCGKEIGRVRAMFNENGKPLKEAGPSAPIEVLGLSGAPEAGDEFIVVADERKAREIALHREEKLRSTKLAAQQAAKLEDVFSLMGSEETIDLNLVIKADVQGSLEALRSALTELSTDKVKVRVIGGGVGGISETDANLALASNAILIGFNVRADGSARKLIEERGIDLHYYSVIYNAIDEVKKSINGMLEPEFKEQIIGIAQVREVFRSSKFGTVAGCLVVEGHVRRNLPIRVLRDNVVIFEGQLESLRRFKDDVNEVKSGMECGIAVRNYNDVREGDQIEVFEKVQVAPH
ncbi:translation initiation factor IF-2 [Methylococcus capsulatus]|uniref:Translation initiation factor IF-2 n=1 Tax=Methylococcus capsulatus (strain ATCC 33009 / NCIMB 11132 / Bath) TaxID=243233 RepID=IF2_METCA|nr:translation initiation factor IF-2 [Methylococcus capsulatus]Q609C0.1 RecName: Full=Translation initiation factor IF-2 [Methylococcus capsulatus str. Bath]AAU92656.1 translation initiation factor IF-2 [Methylococcus capsulatus str. Bath]QXP90678.1 translation initiation factor IF-2 [Methylococcus capsulatus]